MRSIRGLLAALCLLAAARPAAAQGTGSIQGTVTDAATGAPLPGAQVRLAAGGTGAVTGADGRYVLRPVEAGTHTVRVRLIGYGGGERAVTVAAGQTATADFTLSSANILLDNVVVTALGIPREERAISTSVQEVGGDQLVVGEPNVVAALSGRVSGVTITNSNTPGGSSRIVIRGANSLTGNNQPLFVVDGVPVSNSAPGWSQGSSGYEAIDYGNVIQDLNPQDIESISVLKGPNAAALYGSRASNGAVIITTRSGRGQNGVTAGSTVTFERPLLLPDYQDLYGQGSRGQYAYVDGRGSGTYDDKDESWGPRLDDGRNVTQFFSGGQAAPWVSHPDNVRDFFETGRTTNVNAAFSSSREGSSVRFSVANLNQNGMYPGFELTRTTAALNGVARLNERLNASASVQYIDSDAENRPAQGYGEDNVMWQFMWFGRQVDTGLLRRRQYNEDGTQFNWNNKWNNNPYWTALVNGNQDERDRVIGSATLSYEIAPWLNGMVRSGTDWYQENRNRTYQAGTIGVRASGAFSETDVFQRETNTDFLLSTDFAPRGDFSLNGNFGGNRRDNTYRRIGRSADSLVVPGLFDMNNAAVSGIPDDWRERRRVNSLYGSAQASFRETYFLEVTGRNDWSSTLPEDNRSYFYPSVAGNVIVSNLIDVPHLQYGKVRASWSRVGNDTEPYQLVDPYASDLPFGSNPRYTASNRLRNASLEPEETSSWEVGTELRGAGGRFGIDLTYYRERTTNQIVPVNTTPMTGFTERMLNAGEISNRGVELLVDLTPLQDLRGFTWDLTANYTRNRSRVESLYGDLQSITLGSYYNVSVQARPGEAYGVMYGRKYVRDSQDRIVVGSNGVPLTNGPVERLGKYEPDWTGGIASTLSYRGATLGVSVDGRFGGNIYSLTNAYGRRSGVLASSLPGRETAIELADGGGLVVPGVKVVAGDTVANDIRVLAETYHRGITSIAEEFVYDASFVKLREVRLGYRIPGRYTSRVGVRGLDVALVGRNLALWTDVPNIDPETAFNASNVQGFEYGQLPSARSWGFTVNVTP